MKIDLNKTARRLKDIDDISTIDKSRYLTEKVPCANYSGVDVFAVPVNAERVTDPLFYREGLFVGTIVAIQLGNDLPDIFTTKDDESIQKYAVKERIGDRHIAKLSPKCIYTDGIHVYGVYDCYLIELEEMLLYHLTSLNEDVYRNFRYGFIERHERAQIYDREIKPDMQAKSIFPIIVDIQKGIVNCYENKVADAEDNLRDLKRKLDDAYCTLYDLISG